MRLLLMILNDGVKLGTSPWMSFAFASFSVFAVPGVMKRMVRLPKPKSWMLYPFLRFSLTYYAQRSRTFFTSPGVADDPAAIWLATSSEVRIP